VKRSKRGKGRIEPTLANGGDRRKKMKPPGKIKFHQSMGLRKRKGERKTWGKKGHPFVGTL